MIYIASTKENVGLIKEDLYIRDHFLANGLDATIDTIDNISSKVLKGDAVILKSIWGYHLEPDVFLNQIESINNSGARLINNYNFLLWNFDKLKYLPELKEVNTVPTLELNLSELIHESDILIKLKAISKLYKNDKLVIKPSVSASGYRTFLLDFANEPSLIIHDMLSSGISKFMTQPFREEISHGEISVVLISGELMYGVNRYPGILYRKDTSEIIEPHKIPQEILSQTDIVKGFFIEKFKSLPIICRIDFLKHGEIFEILEVELIDPDLYFRVLDNNYLNKALSTLLNAIKIK